ncbi:MAG: ribosome small subunit-dependent GTPase A, partial [Ignavibacteria bacterium]
EPGCAVRESIENGSIEEDRYKSYLKLQREINYLQRKQDIKASLLEKKKWKQIHKQAREITKNKYRFLRGV